MKTDLDKAHIGTCKNCNTGQVWVRNIKSKHSEFMGGGRGHFNICFGCVGPVKIWNGPRGRTETPLDWSKEKILKHLEGMKRDV